MQVFCKNIFNFFFEQTKRATEWQPLLHETLKSIKNRERAKLQHRFELSKASPSLCARNLKRDL